MLSATPVGAKAADKGERITTGARRDVLMRGQWHVRPMSAQAMLRQSRKYAQDSIGPLLREDACNGEPGIIYDAANENAGTGESFISTRSGLPSKDEADLSAPSAIGRCESNRENSRRSHRTVIPPRQSKEPP